MALTDGDAAFAAIAGVLGHAQRSIDLELYEFQRADLAALLLDAQERGVVVTAIKDPSERSSRSTWAQLEQGGVKVVAVPREGWRRFFEYVPLERETGLEPATSTLGRSRSAR